MGDDENKNSKVKKSYPKNDQPMVEKDKSQKSEDADNNKTNHATDNPEPAMSTDELKTLNSKLEAEKAKRLQTMAEFENYRKRIESEKAMFGAMANMGIIQELLEINDDLNLALNDENLSLEHAKQSIKTAQDKLKAAASNAGIEAIEVNIGDEFDREKMEAIQAVPDEKNKNKVIVVISSAYKYSNKEGILRPAKVIVGK